MASTSAIAISARSPRACPIRSVRAYFWVRRGELRVAPRAGLIALAAWLANLLSANSILAQDYVYMLGYYIGIGMFIVVVAGLSQAKASPALQRLDAALGELSYPFFLLHWLVGFLTWSLLMPDTVRGWPLFWAALGPTVGAAAILAIASHRLIDPLRLRIRRSTARRDEPEAVAGVPVPQSVS